MRLTIEKVLILKTVKMLAETPEEILAELAGILTEITVSQGEVIFEKGEIGQSMYIIIDGKVRVHDGDHTIVTLEKRDFFGELAVLDPEPRSASVTAVEEAQLFRLDQDSLYELMAEHVEIARGIIRVLCQRLRNVPQPG